MSPFLLLITSALFIVYGAELPSIGARGNHRLNVTDLERQGRWWAKVGDKVYYRPSSLLGLSSHIGDYYYAVGSNSALTDEMKRYRVGGQGRLHIFCLPNGPSTLQSSMPIDGTRRSSFSQLSVLEHASQVHETFPTYAASPKYVHPLSPKAQELEKAAVATITPEAVYNHLELLTALPNQNSPTRSASNPAASSQALAFLMNEFKSMGLTVCQHNFKASGMNLANAVAVIHGQKPGGTVTVGAHYDSIPSEGVAPGAEDNGSGVAVLLALAKAYTDMKVQPEQTVYFVGFAGEEAGLLGSNAFAAELGESSGTWPIPDECKAAATPGGNSFLLGSPLGWSRKGRLAGGARGRQARAAPQHQAIIMDEVGWRSPSLSSLTINLESYDWAAPLLQHLAASSQAHNADTLTIVHSPKPFGSDHMSYLSREFPAVLTINGDDEAYPNYHQSTDTIANVDKTLLSKVAKMNLGALMRVSGVA